MSSLKQFKRSKERTLNGVWAGKDIFDPNPDGTTPEFLLGAAHKSNPRYSQACAKWRSRNPRMYRAGGDLQSEVEKMQRYGLRYGCIFDWRNFQDDDHKPIPFDLGAVQFYLTEYPDLEDALLELAQEKATFMEGAVEDIKGESLTITSGS